MARRITVHNSGSEPRGTIVAFTSARRQDGAAGHCIAVVSDVGNALIRLAALHGSASPFWAEDSVAARLQIGMRVEYSSRDNQQFEDSEYPHKHDDVWCGSVKPLGMQLVPLGKVLEPLVRHTLDDWWPCDVRISGANSPRVRAFARVPSLAVLCGSIIRVDDLPEGKKHVRATLQVGDDVLERVRVVCPQIKAALQEQLDATINTPQLLVLGLARPNLDHAESCGVEPACEILLIGLAACHSQRVSPTRMATSKRKVSSAALPASPQEQERRKKRAARFGLESGAS